MNNFIKLKENRDFRRAYGRGKSFVAPSFVTYILKNRTGNVRLGITAGKKVGGAVQRNRAKRVIFAAFQSVCDNLPNGYDFVIVARGRILSHKSHEISALLEKQLRTARVWKEQNKNEQATD